MMKNYVKPELFFESYELSQNIAACGWDMTFEKKETCQERAVGDPAWGNPQIVVLNEGKCDVVLEGYCYENSADNVTMRIFQS